MRFVWAIWGPLKPSGTVPEASEQHWNMADVFLTSVKNRTKGNLLRSKRNLNKFSKDIMLTISFTWNAWNMFYIGVLTNSPIGKLNLESGLWAVGRRKYNFLVRPRNLNPTFRYLRGVFGQNFKILASKMSLWLNFGPEKSSKKVGFSLGSLYSLALFFQLLVGQLVNDSESCETQNTSIYYR